MKVLMINGSPRQDGCTFTALSEIASSLNSQGIDTEIVHIGTKDIRGCIGCWKCNELGRCVFNDTVNEIADKAAAADGMVLGSPVYFASVNGSMLSLLDRLYASAGDRMMYKPCAVVASARRAGTTATLDILNKYPLINEQPIVSSQYWTMVHGSNPEQVREDEEGMQIMRTLGRNMAWLLKCIESGKNNGISLPISKEEHKRTDFIR